MITDTLGTIGAAMTTRSAPLPREEASRFREEAQRRIDGTSH